MTTNHKGYSLVLTGTDDPSVVGIRAPIGALYQSTDDGTLWEKVDKDDTDWLELAPVPTEEQQSFAYQCTGLEGTTVIIVLPTARLTNGYLPLVTMGATAAGSVNAFKGFRLKSVDTLQTTTQFQIETAVAVEAGDVFNIFIPSTNAP